MSFHLSPKRLVAFLAVFGSAVASPRKPTAETYDYIVVGGGPSGIITAERLSEANKKVLLLERGHGPTVATGGNYTLAWDQSLAPIDVPGLSAGIGTVPNLWTDYMCHDTPSSTAACVLGGVFSINYMVFVHPPAHDFDDKWPTGWKWSDIKPAADRLYSRNPGSTLPSEDGKRYDLGLYTTLASFFKSIGWKAVDMSAQPEEKYQVYSHPAWNIKNALRAGPVRTYLPLAEKRSNFSYKLRIKANRILRSGSTVTGVEVENVDTGVVEQINLNKGGRVVLAAGALSTPRLLLNSGIGPADEITIANQSGIAVPPEKEWIDLPVGHNLKDHPIFYVIVNTTNGVGSEDYALPDTTDMLSGEDKADVSLYEKSRRAGILTQGRHRLIYFSSNDVASDGITRYYQGSCAASGDNIVTMTTYMTHGLTSTGVLGLKTDGTTYFKQSPYLQTEGDVEAATAFIDDMVTKITDPSTGYELSTYLNTSAILGSLTSGIHFSGTAKLGTDDGRYSNGTSVVDTNAKVYGTDNLFIVDGSIHPDLPTGNNQAIIMVVAEAAVAKILAYKN